MYTHTPMPGFTMVSGVFLVLTSLWIDALACLNRGNHETRPFLVICILKDTFISFAAHAVSLSSDWNKQVSSSQVQFCNHLILLHLQLPFVQLMFSFWVSVQRPSSLIIFCIQRTGKKNPSHRCLSWPLFPVDWAGRAARSSYHSLWALQGHQQGPVSYLKLN